MQTPVDGKTSVSHARLVLPLLCRRPVQVTPCCIFFRTGHMHCMMRETKCVPCCDRSRGSHQAKPDSEYLLPGFGNCGSASQPPAIQGTSREAGRTVSPPTAGQHDTVRPPSLRRADHRQDARLDCRRKRRPGIDHARQFGVQRGFPRGECAAFCAALVRTPRFPRVFVGCSVPAILAPRTLSEAELFAKMPTACP